MAEDYTYHRTVVFSKDGVTVKTVAAAEFDALREQVVKLTRRVAELEAAQKPRATSVVSTVDWEDNL